MTSLESGENKTTDYITVECSDGVKIAVDLRLFPSEMLRQLAQSQFADNKTTRIIYDSATFTALYNKYLPSVEDYFQLVPCEDRIQILDFGINFYCDWIFSGENHEKEILEAFGMKAKLKISLNVVSDNQVSPAGTLNSRMFVVLCDLTPIDDFAEQLRKDPDVLMVFDFTLSFKDVNITSETHLFNHSITPRELIEDIREDPDGRGDLLMKLKLILTRVFTGQHPESCELIHWLKYYTIN
jgi:hypothetical protein